MVFFDCEIEFFHKLRKTVLSIKIYLLQKVQSKNKQIRFVNKLIYAVQHPINAPVSKQKKIWQTKDLRKEHFEHKN